MQVTVPLSDLKLSTINALQPGDFFLLDDALCVRVALDDPRYPAAFVRMATFQLDMLRSVTQPIAMRVPTPELCLQVDPGEQAAEKYTPGAVHITPEGALLTVSVPAVGGGHALAYVSLQTWGVGREHPDGPSAFTSWRLVSRSPTQETVIAERAGTTSTDLLRSHTNEQ